MRGRQTIDGRRQVKGAVVMFLVLLLSVVSGPLSSQDVHFTQFFTTPLILNPAQTGNFNGNYRIGFNFKAQWPWAIQQGSTYNYHTETPYIDFSFGEKQIKTGWMGIGFNFLNDQAGDGMLTYRRATLSFAYHQTFDEDHKYVLSAGANVSYVNRLIDFSKLYFNNQWVEDVGFNTSLDPNEQYKKESFDMVDVGAGLNFRGQVHYMVNLTLGFNMLHLNRPKHSFYNGDERLGLRYQGNTTVQIKTSDRFFVDVDGYYTFEKKASQVSIGSKVGYSMYNWKTNDLDHTVYAGIYYRVKDALAPLIGYQFQKTRLLVSYDVTLSKLVKPGRANGGPEISLVHVGAWGQNHYNGSKVYCPKF